MSQEIQEFKVPKARINYQNLFPIDPNYTPTTNFQNSKIKFSGKICRFTGVINQSLFEHLQEDLEFNLY